MASSGGGGGGGKNLQFGAGDKNKTRGLRKPYNLTVETYSFAALADNNELEPGSVSGGDGSGNCGNYFIFFFVLSCKICI